MTITAWAGTHHALAAALRAMAVNTPRVLDSNDWNDPFCPPVPVAPTIWNWPKYPYPANGGYYDGEQVAASDARAIPFLEVSPGMAYREEYTDASSDFWVIPVNVRARVGLAQAAFGGEAIVLTRRQAQSLCRAAMIAIGIGIKSAAREMDTKTGLGIVYTDHLTSALIDVTAPYVPSGYDTTVCDATGTINIYQRQYAMSGVRGFDLTPKPTTP